MRLTVSGEAATRGSFASISLGMKTVCPNAYSPIGSERPPPAAIAAAAAGNDAYEPGV